MAIFVERGGELRWGKDEYGVRSKEPVQEARQTGLTVRDPVVTFPQA